MKEKKNCQQRTFYPEKLSFKTEGEIKTFPENTLKEFIASRPAL